jgi:hypothetical protein
VLRVPQAQARTEEEARRDAAEESCNECALLQQVATGGDAEGVERLLADLAYAWHLQQ